jgi:hypothetical protein
VGFKKEAATVIGRSPECGRPPLRRIDPEMGGGIERTISIDVESTSVAR